MKKLLFGTVAVALAVTSFGVSAEPNDTKQNTSTECKIDPNWKQSKINETIESCKDSLKESPKEIIQTVENYSGLAKEIALAIGTVAKEVGVATNEFIKTDAGKLTIALIVWHVAGEDILGILTGMSLIVFSASIFFYIQGQIRLTSEYREVTGWFGRKKSVPIKRSLGDLSENSAGSLWAIGFICLMMFIVGTAYIA